jgi:hypothetical protein
MSTNRMWWRFPTTMRVIFGLIWRSSQASDYSEVLSKTEEEHIQYELFKSGSSGKGKSVRSCSAAPNFYLRRGLVGIAPPIHHLYNVSSGKEDVRELRTPIEYQAFGRTTSLFNLLPILNIFLENILHKRSH